MTTTINADSRRALRIAVAVVVGCLIVAISVLGVIWGAGFLGSVMVGQQPVKLSVEEVFGVAAQLPDHLQDPVRAWPRRDWSRLPDRSILFAFLFFGLAGVITALVFTRRSLIALGIGEGVLGSRRKSMGSSKAARWAQSNDLSDMRVRGASRGRLVLGRHNGRLIAAQARSSVLVCAPSQSGKTTGLAIPALLEWDGPVLATSVKGDLVVDTHAARSVRGDVWVFDPSGSTDFTTACWSPIAASTSWEEARRTAAGLLGVGESGGRSSDDAFWRPAAARYLAPLLLAAAEVDESIGTVLQWIALSEKELVSAALERSDVPGARIALDSLISVWEADDRFRSSVLQTAATALDAWQEPSVQAATGSELAITADELLAGSNTLYLTAPAHDQRRLRGLFTTLISHVITAAFMQSARTGRAIDPPLLVCLDEAANVAPLSNLDEIAATSPGQGVQLLSVFQNMAQISDRWGRDRAETIIANHRTRIFGSGVSDRQTLEYLGAVLGDEEIQKISTHKRGAAFDPGSRTLSHESKRLAAPHRIRQAAQNTALLVHGNAPPAWITLRPWYSEKDLKKLVVAQTVGV